MDKDISNGNGLKMAQLLSLIVEYNVTTIGGDTYRQYLRHGLRSCFVTMALDGCKLYSGLTRATVFTKAVLSKGGNQEVRHDGGTKWHMAFTTRHVMSWRDFPFNSSVCVTTSSASVVLYDGDFDQLSPKFKGEYKPRII
ncbi:hypothetical protein OH492_05365 [Vibrio chagasii]|nr:hypothetical protein [Vibrio chagasii]